MPGSGSKPIVPSHRRPLHPTEPGRRAAVLFAKEDGMAEPRLRLVGGIEDLGSGDPVNPVDKEKTTGRKRLPGLQDYRIDTAPPPTSVVYGGLARKLELRCLMLQR